MLRQGVTWLSSWPVPKDKRSSTFYAIGSLNIYVRQVTFTCRRGQRGSGVDSGGQLDTSMNRALAELPARHGAIAGTVHVVKDDALVIAAAHNIPPKVQEVTARIPLGKGMAGLAWQHDKPISTCNLQEDA